MSVDRARGALVGLAVGDALGMPTQSMSPEQIAKHYGSITGLVDAVPEQPIAPSMPAGAITDDTEQALLVADLLIEGEGRIDPARLAETLLAWEADMRARGSLDLLGPSTKLALERVHAGEDPRITGRAGTTNGASMRVAPVGIAFSLQRIDRFADAVHESCLVTHDTHQGWEAAALIAAAVSAGVEGATASEAVATALDTVAALPRRGYWSPKASVLERSRDACERGSQFAPQGGSADRTAFEEFLRDAVGTSVDSTESVPAALVIAAQFADAPFEGLCVAANLGGDTDTIAAMAGAILGACGGEGAFSAEVVDTVTTVSGVTFDDTARALLDLRRR